MMKSRSLLHVDPPRWIDRQIDRRIDPISGEEPEDRAAARLRGALPLVVPEISWRPERLTPPRDRVRLRLSFALAAILFLSMGVGIGVAGTSYGWFAFERPRAEGEQRIDVAAGNVARLRRAGRWRAALTGPAVASVDDDGEVRLTSGTITLAAEESGATAALDDQRVRLERGAVARLALDESGRPAVVIVEGAVHPSGALARQGTERDQAVARHALDPSAPDPDRAPPPAAVQAPPSPPAPVREPAELQRPSVRVRAAAPPRETSADVAPAALEAPPLLESADSEAAALSAALTALRRQRDANAAIALVDQSLARHPDGALVPEMVAVRVEALLARGDAAQALAALDALPTARVPLDRRLQTVRGELRANAGRCDEALVDFTATLRAAPADSVDERALRGRASCDAALQDQTALRADLELYVRQFPDRPFAPEARRRLGTP